MSRSFFFRIISLAAVSLVLLTATALAGDGSDGAYRLRLTVGGGGSLSTTPAGIPSGMSADVSKFGPALTGRLMWCPDHLLSIGLESGWTSVYSYTTSGPEAGKVSLTQIPMYTVFAMRPWEGVQLLGGYGYSRLNSTLDYAGTITGGSWSMGWIAAASYERPIANKLALAGELKWINAIENETAVVTLQVQLVWDFFEW